MAGRVIQALRDSRFAPVLTEAELRALANCGQIETFQPNDAIIAADGRDERMFVLREGKVNLALSMWSEGGHCGGSAAFDVETPGEPLGWAAWVRSDRITVAATATAPTSVIAFDFRHLGDAPTLLKVSERMVQLLYARLQEGGICPPDVQGLLRWQHFAHP